MHKHVFDLFVFPTHLPPGLLMYFYMYIIHVRGASSFHFAPPLYDAASPDFMYEITGPYTMDF